MSYKQLLVIILVAVGMPCGYAGDKSEKTEPLPLDIVKEEFAQGKKYLSDRQADLAWLFFRNAAALETLAEKDNDGKRAKAMNVYVERSLTLNSKKRYRCPVCVNRVALDKIHGSRRGLSTYFKKCPRCEKKSTILKPASVDEWKKRIASARKRFAGIQTKREMKLVGAVWIPEEWAGKLSSEQKALLAKALPETCEQCQGAGEEDCPVCKGLGEVKCPRCKMGIVQYNQAKLLKHTVLRYEHCKTCNGIGGGLCGRCDGKGRKPCTHCTNAK